MRIIIEREGTISSADADEMYATMRALAEAGNLPKRAVRIFIEMVQNLRLHGGGVGCVSVVADGDLLVIRTTNAADAETVDKVVNLVEFANAHAEHLTSVIQKMRAMPMKQNAYGAGLGIFEIRRLCGCDMAVSSKPRPDGYLELVIAARLNHKSIL